MDYTPKQRIRYALVGLGHIAQVAVLPAFQNAASNSELTALVSGDGEKLKELGGRHGIKNTYSYDEYDKLLESDLVDAVFITLPNDMHCEYSVRAMQKGKHVLCEKPMAVTENECHQMIAAADASDVRLMIAYRLHFEKANLEAIQILKSGKIGDVRFFVSTFSQQLKEGNYRLEKEQGGGSVYDIGIYCINAARYLFQAEPVEVWARSVSNSDPRFQEIDEMTTVAMRFPGERLASFTCSFGASDVSSYRIVGTKGDLRLEPAYAYTSDLIHYLTVNGTTRRKTYVKRDQFAAELAYFSQCVQNGEQPETSGIEGLADVRIIEAINRSAKENAPCAIEPIQKSQRPTLRQENHKPAVPKPELVKTESPTIK